MDNTAILELAKNAEKSELLRQALDRLDEDMVSSELGAFCGKFYGAIQFDGFLRQILSFCSRSIVQNVFKGSVNTKSKYLFKRRI